MADSIRIVLVCLTLQAEGCTLELWNTHKNLLKKNFGQLVNEVRAQRWGQQETGHQGDQRDADTSTTANPPRPVLRAHGIKYPCCFVSVVVISDSDDSCVDLAFVA